MYISSVIVSLNYMLTRWLTINKHRVGNICYGERISLSTAVYTVQERQLVHAVPEFGSFGTDNLFFLKKVLFKRWLTINKHRVEYKCYDEQLSLSTAVYKWGKNPQSEVLLLLPGLESGMECQINEVKPLKSSFCSGMTLSLVVILFCQNFFSSLKKSSFRWSGL